MRFKIFLAMFFHIAIISSFEGCNYEKDKDINNVVYIINAVEKEQQSIASLSSLLFNNIKIPFFAEYSIKPHEFFYFNIVNGNIQGSFTINETLNSKVVELTRNLSIKKIWKFENENFYRMEIIGEAVKNIQILSLQPEEIEFSIPLDSKFNNLKRVNNTKDLIKGQSSDILFSVGNNLIIAFM